MGSLALRRTKTSTGPDGTPLVTLPSKTVQLVTLDLGPEDAANYSALEDETRKLVSRGENGGLWVCCRRVPSGVGAQALSQGLYTDPNLCLASFKLS